LDGKNAKRLGNPQPNPKKVFIIIIYDLMDAVHRLNVDGWSFDGIDFVYILKNVEIFISRAG
jgi:hypothetical protein